MRTPVQVIATTHNPYFLDLFRDHPDEIVIAEKVGLDAKFSRLSDRADLEEILGDGDYGEPFLGNHRRFFQMEARHIRLDDSGLLMERSNKTA